MAKKQEFVAVAAVIRRNLAAVDESQISVAVVSNLARDLADMYKADNHRFDRARFLAACGVVA